MPYYTLVLALPCENGRSVGKTEDSDSRGKSTELRRETKEQQQSRLARWREYDKCGRSAVTTANSTNYCTCNNMLSPSAHNRLSISDNQLKIASVV